MSQTMSIYQKMIAAGVKVDNHYSDLYAPVNPVTEKIVSEYEHKSNVTTFHGGQYYDIPFAFDPYWEAKQNQQKQKTGAL